MTMTTMIEVCGGMKDLFTQLIRLILGTDERTPTDSAESPVTCNCSSPTSIKPITQSRNPMADLYVGKLQRHQLSVLTDVRVMSPAAVPAASGQQHSRLGSAARSCPQASNRYSSLVICENNRKQKTSLKSLWLALAVVIHL